MSLIPINELKREKKILYVNDKLDCTEILATDDLNESDYFLYGSSARKEKIFPEKNIYTWNNEISELEVNMI